MKRYWIVAPSKNDVYHWADGRVVLAIPNLQEMMDLHEDAEVLKVRVYCMDLNKEASNFIVPINKLSPWHKKNSNHKHCYCLRNS